MIIKVRPISDDPTEIEMWRLIAEANQRESRIAKKNRANKAELLVELELKKERELASKGKVYNFFKRLFCNHKYEAFGGVAIPDFKCNKCHKVTGLSLF